jgi:ribosomal protein S18 acetylase RimI-like enzyme
MTSIIKATIEDADLLSKIGKQSFIESHGISAPVKDITNYVSSKFTKEVFERELEDSNNIFHIVFYNEKPIGYSKIIYNVSQENISIKNVTKLERLYVLKEFHHLKLGLELFNFNVELSKNQHQAGMWLFVWTENQKALNFYIKAGFKIVGKYDFKISETHSNPNHQMLLTY